jgi:hypothetical protein
MPFGKVTALACRFRQQFADVPNTICDPGLHPRRNAKRFVNAASSALWVCRTCDDRAVFQQRCRDTALDGRGFILLLVDADIEDLLMLKASGREQDIDRWLDGQFRSIVF